MLSKQSRYHYQKNESIIIAYSVDFYIFNISLKYGIDHSWTPCSKVIWSLTQLMVAGPNGHMAIVLWRVDVEIGYDKDHAPILVHKMADFSVRV